MEGGSGCGAGLGGPECRVPETGGDAVGKECGEKGSAEPDEKGWEHAQHLQAGP